MTSYAKAIKVGRWTQTTQVQNNETPTPLKSVIFYSKNIGTSGYGGCSFYEMKPNDFTNLIHYFNEYNIPYLEFSDKLNYDDDSVWWSYSEHHHNTNQKTQTVAGMYPICSAGYKFIISKAAHLQLYNANV